MTGGQENRREVGRGGNLVRGGDVPSRRVSPGDTIRVGLKDGGGRRENFFFPPCRVACSRSRWPEMGDGRS